MYIEESVNMKFLGLQIDNHLNWTNHIDKLIPKLHGARHAVRSMCHISNTDTLKSIYFDYFRLIMKYRIILAVSHLTAQRQSLYKRKLLDSQLVLILEFHVKVCLRAYRS
jgi:hypothetical protein